MVIPERKNQVAYYYRITHNDHGYDKYTERGGKPYSTAMGTSKKRSSSFGMKLPGLAGSGRSSGA